MLEVLLWLRFLKGQASEERNNPVVFGKRFGMSLFSGMTLMSVLAFALAEAILTDTLKQIF